MKSKKIIVPPGARYIDLKAELMQQLSKQEALIEQSKDKSSNRREAFGRVAK